MVEEEWPDAAGCLLHGAWCAYLPVLFPHWGNGQLAYYKRGYFEVGALEFRYRVVGGHRTGQKMVEKDGTF